MNSGGAVGGAFGGLFIIFLICYFIPTAIALLRKHKDAPAIAAINILLGWSVVGWFVSFIWSLSDPNGRGGSQTVVIHNTAQHNVAVAPPGSHEYPSSQPNFPPIITPATTRPTISAPMREITADPDTAFWDSMTDKNDPDLLEEYLIRFPAGRFAQLARNKLERKGFQTAVATEPTAPKPQPNVIELGSASPAQPKSIVCNGCDATLEPESKFCTDCGSAVAA
jgi:hypothetical protein